MFFIGYPGLFGMPPPPKIFRSWAPTKITITKDGTPETGVRVTVFSQALNNYVCYGDTDTQGVAEIKTYTDKVAGYPGAPTGTIRVGLYRSPYDPKEDPRDFVKGKSREEVYAYYKKRNEEAKKHGEFAPEILRIPKQSPASFEVVEGQSNDFSIEVNDPLWNSKSHN